MFACFHHEMPWQVCPRQFLKMTASVAQYDLLSCFRAFLRQKCLSYRTYTQLLSTCLGKNLKTIFWQKWRAGHFLRKFDKWARMTIRAQFPEKRRKYSYKYTNKAHNVTMRYSGVILQNFGTAYLSFHFWIFFRLYSNIFHTNYPTNLKRTR